MRRPRLDQVSCYLTAGPSSSAPTVVIPRFTPAVGRQPYREPGLPVRRFHSRQVVVSLWVPKTVPERSSREGNSYSLPLRSMDSGITTTRPVLFSSATEKTLLVSATRQIPIAPPTSVDYWCYRQARSSGPARTIRAFIYSR